MAQLTRKEKIHEARGVDMKTEVVLKKVKGFTPESFDRVLLDPPCSALGLRPRLNVTATMEELDNTVHVQKRLVWAAAMLLKPEGRMVYSTCTVNPAENEMMVAHILREFPFLELVDTVPHVASPGLAGMGLSEEQRRMVQRFQPGMPGSDDGSAQHVHGQTTGFFIAAFRKTGSAMMRMGGKAAEVSTAGGGLTSRDSGVEEKG